MRSTLSTFHRMTRWLGPLLGLVLTCTVVTQATHRHSDGDSHHLCVICSASHSPAVATAAAPTATAIALQPRDVVVIPLVPRALSITTPRSSRAPPA